MALAADDRGRDSHCCMREMTGSMLTSRLDTHDVSAPGCFVKCSASHRNTSCSDRDDWRGETSFRLFQQTQQNPRSPATYAPAKRLRSQCITTSFGTALGHNCGTDGRQPEQVSHAVTHRQAGNRSLVKLMPCLCEAFCCAKRLDLLSLPLHPGQYARSRRELYGGRHP